MLHHDRICNILMARFLRGLVLLKGNLSYLNSLTIIVMHSGFNLILTDSDWKEIYFDGGIVSIGEVKSVPSHNDETYYKELLNELCQKSVLQADEIKKELFPSVKATVFISHSHDDLKKAMWLTNWLREAYKIRAFIDTDYWGNYKDILKCLNDMFCKDNSFPKRRMTRYYYEEVINATAHVHMMLISSINEMIDNTDWFFFINTPNSFQRGREGFLRKIPTRGQMPSPWIHHELNISRIVKRRRPSIMMEKCYRPASKRLLTRTQSLSITHQQDLDHLLPCNKDDLMSWVDDFSASRSSALALNRKRPR